MIDFCPTARTITLFEGADVTLQLLNPPMFSWKTSPIFAVDGTGAMDRSARLRAAYQLRAMLNIGVSSRAPASMIFASSASLRTGPDGTPSKPKLDVGILLTESAAGAVPSDVPTISIVVRAAAV